MTLYNINVQNKTTIENIVWMNLQKDEYLCFLDRGTFVSNGEEDGDFFALLRDLKRGNRICYKGLISQKYSEPSISEAVRYQQSVLKSIWGWEHLSPKTENKVGKT